MLNNFPQKVYSHGCYPCEFNHDFKCTQTNSTKKMLKMLIKTTPVLEIREKKMSIANQTLAMYIPLLLVSCLKTEFCS